MRENGSRLMPSLRRPSGKRCGLVRKAAGTAGTPAVDMLAVEVVPAVKFRPGTIRIPCMNKKKTTCRRMAPPSPIRLVVAFSNSE